MSICLKIASVLATFALSQNALAQCTGGAATVAANAGGVEYARGTPKAVDVNDGGKIVRLNYLKAGNQAIYEGDIIIGDADQLDFASQAGPIFLYHQTGNEITPFGLMAKSVLFGSRKWTNNTVPFVIDPNLPAADLVLQSMKAWMDVTKVRFVERMAGNASSHPNYVYFTNGTNPYACLSAGLGMMGGRQNVELVSGCGFGQIVHEIGHVLGLDHEQNRSDRNAFVQVHFENMVSGYRGQFEQRPSAYKDIGSYDFDSIMHYEPSAFSCNGQPTITSSVSLPPGVQLGQRTHISQGDIAAINGIYK
jgi:astacin